MKQLLAMALLTASCLSMASTTSTSTQSSLSQKLQDNLAITYFSVYQGPGVMEMNMHPIDRNGNVDEEASVNIWNQVSFRYKLNDELGVVVNPRFGYNMAPVKGQDMFEVFNPVMGFNYRKKFSDRLSGSFNLDMVTVHVQEGSKDNGMITNPGGFQSLSYKFSNKIDLGFWAFGRFTFYEENEGKERYSFLWAPTFNYNFTDKFSLTTWIEQYHDHMSTDRLGDMKYVGSIYYIGADISVKSYFGIRPYLMYDMREIQSIKSVSLGAWLWGKLF
jgi:hypothetical protein